MDIFDAARFFDDMAVVDAYTNAPLFTCGMDQDGGTESDGAASWRRTCSASRIVIPSRGVVRIGGEVFIAGRITRNYFDNQVIREHLLLHPSDGLFTIGPARQFIEASPGMRQFHGALAVRKQTKEAGESSQLFNVYDIYTSLTENAARDVIIRDPNNVFYRVQNSELQTGNYRTIYASELGPSALLQVTYTPSSGVYNPITDITGTGAPILIWAFFERYQSNYRYMTWAAEKFQNGDRILTVNAVNVVTPVSDETVTVSGVVYRVLSVQSDGLGCWELHLR